MIDDPKAARIEQEIQQTRAELDETLDALKDKLTPGAIVDEVLPQIQEKGMTMGRNFVRNNPVPLALMATGLAWMLLRNGEHSSETRPNGRDAGPGLGLNEAEHEAIEHHDFVHDTLSGVKRRAGETVEAFNERMYEAKAGVLGLKHSAAEELSQFRQRVDHAFADLSAVAASGRRKVARQGARVKAGARAFAHAAEARGGRIAAEGRDYYEEHPLIVGALGVAAGAALGALLPHSDAEDRLLGGTGERLRHRASDAADAVKDAGRRVVGSALEAARREGLTREGVQAATEDVLDRAKRVGEDAIQSGREEIEARRPAE